MAGISIVWTATPSPNWNVTTDAPDDWALWNSGSGSGTNVAPSQRKSGGGSTIGNMTCTVATLDGFTAGIAQATWSGGTPTASGANKNAIYNSLNGGGSSTNGADCSFTLPADTSQREAKYRFATYGGAITLTCTLSDGSAGPTTNTSLSDPGVTGTAGYYTITYSAASAGQTLTVKAAAAANAAFADVEPQGVTVRVLSSGTNVTPGVGALALTGFAPTVARTANQAVTPGVGALALSGFAPTVARTANQAVAPGVGELTLAGFAPTVSQSAGLNLTPGVAALVLTGYAPSLAQTVNQSLTPGVGSLTLTGYAPTISQPQVVSPGVGALSLTGFAPTVAQTANQGVSPGSGALTLTGYAPSIGQTANQALVPGVGSLTITGYAPAVSQQSSSPALTPDTAVLTITGYVPTVQQGSPVVLLGGGPGLPRKRRKDGTESYLERLLGRPLEDEEPEQIEVIEQAAEIAAIAPQSPSKEDAAESLRAYGIALKDAYLQVYLELEQKKRQAREDEEIAAVIAAAL